MLFWLIIHDRLRPSEQTDVYTSDSDGVLGGHKGLYWFGRNVPTSSLRLLVLLALICKGLQTGERGRRSQVSRGRSEHVLLRLVETC